MNTALTRKLGLIFYVALLSFGALAKARDTSLFDKIDRSSAARSSKRDLKSAADSHRRKESASQFGTGANQRKLIAPQRPTLNGGSGMDVQSQGSRPAAIDPNASGNRRYSDPAAIPQAYVQPSVMPVLPESCGFIPKLGFYGRLIPGVGMEVVNVNYGGIAFQKGFEPGDIIVEINGRPILYDFDYETALVDAAVYSYGQVSLLVRNVRYQPGCMINREFVRVYARLPMRHPHVHAQLQRIVAAR